MSNAIEGLEPSLEHQRSELINRLPWSAEIFLPTKKISLEEQVEGLKRVANLQEKRLFRTYSSRLNFLRDKYKNTKRCFIIGNGPSLNQTDLSQLEGEVTFCVNGFFLKMPELSWTPTFYVVEDHLVAEDRADAINSLRGPTKLFPAYLAYCLNEGPDTVFFNHRSRVSFPDGFDFSTDASRITYTGCTVTFTCMQLAHFMGFREIYLIGVDASYDIPDDAKHADNYGTGILDMESDDPNHFHPDYFGKGYRWHDPQVHKMLDAYAEARRVTDALGRPIYNATAGGKLEVFERRAYSEIFPAAMPSETPRALEENETNSVKRTKSKLEIEARRVQRETHNSSFPKVALIDMTPADGNTATGALKRRLFEGWPEERLLQVYAESRYEISIAGAPRTRSEGPLMTQSAYHASQVIAAYDADVIIYRPLPERQILHEVFKSACELSNASKIVWMMDDWPAKLEFDGDPEANFWNENLLECLASANAHLSIGDMMSAAYLERYGLDFFPIANGIEPNNWPPGEPRTSGPLLIRYSGNLSESMSLFSLLKLAETIEKLENSPDICFEIQTRDHWADLHAEKFSRFKRTSVKVAALSEAEYRTWITEADISVIAYNFDEATKPYVRYSMANKLPEILASGSSLLAIGPAEIATIDYLLQHELGVCITQNSSQKIEEVLRRTLGSKERRKALGHKQREHALRNLNVGNVRNRFWTHIRSAAKERNPNRTNLNEAYLEYLVAPNSHLSSREIVTIKDKPEHLKFSKPRRMLRFYVGWRGILATATVALSALPAIYGLLTNSWGLMIVMLGPVIAIVMVILFFAYLFTVLEDHHYL